MKSACTKEKKKLLSAKLRKGVIIAIASVLLIAVTILLITISGLPQRKLRALTINSVPITVGEYNFHYYNAYMKYAEAYGDYFGWDGTEDLSSLQWTETMTFSDVFHQLALDNLTALVTQSEQARRDGISLTEAEQKDLQSAAAAYADEAATVGMKLSEYLEKTYGRGLTEKILYKTLEREALALAWQRCTTNAVTDDGLEVYYNDRRVKYDVVTYHAYSIHANVNEFMDGDDDDDMNEDYAEAYETAIEKAGELANEMLSRITDADSFLPLAREYSALIWEDDDDFITLQSNIPCDFVLSYLSDFLLDETREPFDKTVIVDEKDFTVVLFLSRGRADNWESAVCADMIADYITELNENAKVTKRVGMRLAGSRKQ